MAGPVRGLSPPSPAITNQSSPPGPAAPSNLDPAGTSTSRLTSPSRPAPVSRTVRTRAPARKSATGDGRLERDLGAGQGARDRAVLGLRGYVAEEGVVDAGNVAHRAQLDPGDIEAGADLGERHPRGGAQIPRGITRLAQQVRERHREAGGLGRADQLLGVGGPHDIFDAGPQRIRPLEGTAAERYPAAAVRHGSPPARLGAPDDAETQDALPSRWILG